MDAAVAWSILAGLCLASTAEASPERVLLADSHISSELKRLVAFELSGWSWHSIDELVGDIELVSVGSGDVECSRLSASALARAVDTADERIQLMEFEQSLEIIESSFSNLPCLDSVVATGVLQGLYVVATRLEEITGVASEFHAARRLETLGDEPNTGAFYAGQWSGGGGDLAGERPQIWVDGVLEPRSVSSGSHLVQLVDESSGEVLSSGFRALDGAAQLLWAERDDANHSLSFRLSRELGSIEPSPLYQALERIRGSYIYRVVEASGAAVVRRVDGSTVVTIMEAPSRKIVGVGFGLGASGGLVGDPTAAGTAWLRYSPYLGLNLVASIEGGVSADLLPPGSDEFWAIREQWTLLGGVRVGAPLGVSGWAFGGDIAQRRSEDQLSVIGYRISTGAFRSAWEDAGVRTVISGTKWPDNWDVSLNIGLEWSR